MFEDGASGSRPPVPPPNFSPIVEEKRSKAPIVIAAIMGALIVAAFVLSQSGS